MRQAHLYFPYAIKREKAANVALIGLAKQAADRALTRHSALALFVLML